MLLRGILGELFDPLRLSIDSVTDTDVADAYREIGSDPAAVRVLPYTPTASADDFRAFHLDCSDFRVIRIAARAGL